MFILTLERWTSPWPMQLSLWLHFLSLQKKMLSQENEHKMEQTSVISWYVILAPNCKSRGSVLVSSHTSQWLTPKIQGNLG